MATLIRKRRAALAGGAFGLRGKRKLPLVDLEQARMARALAGNEAGRRTITETEQRRIDRRADQVLQD